MLTTLLGLVSTAAADCADAARAMPEDLDAAKASVVVVQMQDGTGSGVLIDPDGLVITAAHVVGTNERVEVTTGAGLRLEATVVRASGDLDLALLQLPGSGHACSALSSSRPTTGSDLFVIGAPASPDLAASVTKGITSGFPTLEHGEFLQTDAPINPGNSGGPVFANDGTVAGIATFKLAGPDYEGLGFAVPADVVLDWLASGPETDSPVETPAKVDQKAAAAEFRERAVWFEDYVGINSATGQQVASWSEPRKGVYGEPMNGLQFYEYIGRDDLADEYRRRNRRKWTAIAVSGGVGVVGLGGMLSTSYVKFGTRQQTDAVYNASLGALSVGGLAAGAIGTVVKSDPLKPHERKKLAATFNAELADELGLILEE